MRIKIIPLPGGGLNSMAGGTPFTVVIDQLQCPTTVAEDEAFQEWGKKLGARAVLVSGYEDVEYQSV